MGRHLLLLQHFVNVPNTPLPASPIILTIPAGAPAAGYAANITFTNTTSGCSQTKADSQS